MNPAESQSQIDLAKMAAIIDCEGNVTISTAKGKPNFYVLQVTVGNCDFRLLEWCKARFGGAIYQVYYKKQRGPRYAPIKRWRLQKQSASELLSRCLDHFIIKREQAEIGIALQRIFAVRYRRISPSERQACEEMKLKLQRLTGQKGGQLPTEQKSVELPQRNLFATERPN